MPTGTGLMAKWGDRARKATYNALQAVGFDPSIFLSFLIAFLQKCSEKDPAKARKLAFEVRYGHGNPVRNATIRASLKRHLPKGERTVANVNKALDAAIKIDEAGFAAVCEECRAMAPVGVEDV